MESQVHLSQEILEKLNFWSNVAYLTFLLLTFAATFAVVYFGGQLAAVQKTQIANLNLQTAQANARAEDERSARLKLERRIAPRFIAPEDTSRFVATLSALAGKIVFIDIYASDPDSARYGTELSSALFKAGAHISTSRLLAGTPATGTVIRAGANRESDAIVIRNGLVQFGINPEGIFLIVEPKPPEALSISIGPRP